MEIEGLLVEPNSEIVVGDLYFARRNASWQLLTAARVVPVGPFGTRGYIVPQEMAYCYDIWECLKVVA